jgi:hypothetical protein
MALPWENKPQAEGFEVLEYEKEESVDPARRYSVVKQIVQDFVRTSPDTGYMCSMVGEKLKLTYQCYTLLMLVRGRLDEAIRDADKALDGLMSHVKKEYRRRTGETLGPKEDRDLRDYSIHKVSLNERYMLTRWRVYDLA